MTQTVPNPTEQLARFSRRGMYVMLVLVLALGAGTLATTLSPDGLGARLASRAYLLIPIVIILAVGGLQFTLRGRRWDPRSPEARAILDDELRQTSLARASRAALATVLIAQIPLGLLFMQLPARAVWAMAVSTITLGMATLIALFLYFDRE